MTAEALIFAALQDLAGGRVFPDVADADTARPYITYQAVGGAPINFLTGERPSRQQVRMQVNVWADTRIDASEVGAQVEAALRATVDLQTEVSMGRVATYDEQTGYRGTRQDFQIFC